MGQQYSPYMISSERMWLLRLLENKEPQAHNGSSHGRRTIKLQPVHGLPAEPKQISQTSDSSTGQTTCTCCINPVLLVYFCLASVTPLCSLINTQCAGQDRLKDVINPILAFFFFYFLCIFVANRVSSSLPHLCFFLLVKCSSLRHGVAVTSAFRSIVCLLCTYSWN